jgi:probable addiction module antidote protein
VASRVLRAEAGDLVAVECGVPDGRIEGRNPDVFLATVRNVAKARGTGAIAESTGLARESLHKAIAPGAKPRYDTVLKVLQSLGVKLAVSAA